MCGRYGITIDPQRIARVLRAQYDEHGDLHVPNWNAAPTQRLPIVWTDAGARKLTGSRWGWRRPFTKAPIINARGDQILSKTTMFRKALRERRCVVPASHFFEWQLPPPGSKQKQPFAIGMKGQDTFAMGGIYEEETQDAVTERCHVVLTIEPNALMHGIHDRQPLILPDDAAVDTWLNPEATAEQITSLLCTLPAETMYAWKVGAAVGNVKNNRPDLADPAPEQTTI